MTREILLFGKMRTIVLNDAIGNSDIVLGMREELKELAPGDIGFDIDLGNNCGEVILRYFLDLSEEDIENGDCCCDYLRLITGEGYTDVELPFPIIDDPKVSRFKMSYFAKMWDNNNNELGGDSFKLVGITASYTSMTVYLKFDINTEL